MSEIISLPIPTNLNSRHSSYSHLEKRKLELVCKYGNRLKIIGEKDTYAQTLLAQFSNRHTRRRLFNQLMAKLYQILMAYVINEFFPRLEASVATPMQDCVGDKGILHYTKVDSEISVVIANILRAGERPAIVCQDELDMFINEDRVWQEHFGASRQTDNNGQVTGTAISYTKTTGNMENSILLIPDPMGATGGTVLKAIQNYKEMENHGDVTLVKDIIAVHLIITPEYLEKLYGLEPKLKIVALRLDDGLNEHQYIHPGAGDIGCRATGTP